MIVLQLSSSDFELDQLEG